MALTELRPTESLAEPSGCTLSLGGLTMKQARSNWVHKYWQLSDTEHPVTWQTARIVSCIFNQLAQNPNIEVTEALIQADKLLDDSAPPLERQQHFDACVEAVDLVVSALRYTTHEVNGFIVHSSEDLATGQIPVIAVPDAA